MITLILAGLTLAAGVLGVVGLVAAKDDFMTEFENQGDLGAGEGFYNYMLAGSVIAVVLSAIAIILAVLVLRRSNGARIGLVVVSALAILDSLAYVIFLVPAVNLIAAIAVIVCLFAGGANRWFRRESATPAIPGMQQY